MNGIYKLLLVGGGGRGSGCELEQCSMGNKLGIKEKSLVVVVVRGFGTQKELMFFFVFLNS